MTRTTSLRHEFVDHIPDVLDEGVLYVSIPYTTAAHLCCCGCGVEVITPIDPTGWEMTFDGRSISLRPSIGNWSLDCQSHYWIERDRARWAQELSKRRTEGLGIWNRLGTVHRTGIGLKTIVRSTMKRLRRLNWRPGGD